MKRLVLVIAAVLFSCHLWAQNTVSADSLAYYEGQFIRVCATVTGTHVSTGKSETTFINFGEPFPKHSFSLVIFQKDAESFSYKPAEFLENKNVCITGKVKMYKGRPEIIVSNEKQIRIDE
jgi:RecG-like helicase